MKNSVGVGLLCHGEIIYKNAFGYANGLRNVKAAPDTVYHWWSMTKIPIAIVIV